MRPMNEIEIELPQIVLDRADAAYAQIRQQAAQEKQLTGKRFPRAAGILLAVVILSVTAVSATAAGIMGYRRYLTVHGGAHDRHWYRGVGAFGDGSGAGQCHSRIQ